MNVLAAIITLFLLYYFVPFMLKVLFKLSLAMWFLLPIILLIILIAFLFAS